MALTFDLECIILIWQTLNFQLLSARTYVVNIIYFFAPENVFRGLFFLELNQALY